MPQAKIQNNTLKFSLNLQNYPLEAIYGAAYVFIDKAYLFLDSRSAKKIEVSLKGRKKLTKKQFESLKGEFLNELLNYTLRTNLTKHNRKIREYVVSQALFSTLGEEGVVKEDKIGYQDDPLGIAVPWEEKFGKKSKVKKKRKK